MLIKQKKKIENEEIKRKDNINKSNEEIYKKKKMKKLKKKN